MIDDLDSVDDLLLPPVTATDRTSGKFRPKARAKPIKNSSASLKTSGGTQPEPVVSKPVEPDLGSKHDSERTSLHTFMSVSSIGACEHQPRQESVQQAEVTQAESVASQSDCFENCQQNKGHRSDTGFTLNSSNSYSVTKAFMSAGSVADVQPLLDQQHENKELNASSIAVTEVHESLCASIRNSSCSQSEASQCEINVSRLPLQAEAVICTETSQSRGCIQDAGINMHPNLALPKEAGLECSSVESPDDLLHPSETTAKELLDSESIDGGLKVLLTDGDLQKISDDPLEVEMTVLSGVESMDTFSFQHNSETNVRQVGKFQPKKNKSQLKEATVKSVSFILPNASDVAAATIESSSAAMNQSSMVMIIDRPVDDPLSSSNATSDLTGDLQTNHGRIGEENSEENELPRDHDSIHVRLESENDQEPMQQVQEEITASKINDEAGGSISGRNLRKRITKSRAGNTEGGSINDCSISNYVASQMDDCQSDEGHGDEDVSKPRRAKRKSKQAKEIVKSDKKGIKASEKPDSYMEESPKKKFPHGTRRKRRRVNKDLLQMPEDEINPSQISLRDLIMLAEARERISNKEAAATNKLLSNQGTSSLPKNDDTFMGEDQELNHNGEEDNHNIKPAPKKLNYHSYMNRLPTVRWSKSETELLYEAIRQFGTDFEMIQQLFPNRTRHQIKQKYKIEERKHPLQVHDAILHRSNDHSHIMQVIKQLRSEAKLDSKGETDGDQVNTVQSRVDKHEEETGGIQNEEEQPDDSEVGYQDPEVLNDSKGEFNSPDFNEHENLFEWDEDMDKDSIWDI